MYTYTVSVSVRRVVILMAPRKVSERARGWVLTLNNYTEDEVTQLHNTLDHTVTCDYWILGREVGEQGTPHIQGYVYWKNAKSFNTTKDLLSNDRIHIEKAKAGPGINRSYCAKEENYIEKEGRFNHPPKPFNRPNKDVKYSMSKIRDLMMAEIELQSNIDMWTNSAESENSNLKMRREASNYAAEYKDILDSSDDEILKWYNDLKEKRKKYLSVFGQKSSDATER